MILWPIKPIVLVECYFVLMVVLIFDVGDFWNYMGLGQMGVLFWLFLVEPV
jgi:hypothetical protein